MSRRRPVERILDEVERFLARKPIRSTVEDIISGVSGRPFFGEGRLRIKPYTATAHKEEWMVHRDGVVTAHRRKKKWRVKGHYRPDKGAPGRGKKVIPPLKAGTLRQFGYGLDKPERTRHTALRRAVQDLGYATVKRKLVAIRTLRKNAPPRSIERKQYNIIDKDIKWLDKTFRGK